MSAKRDFDLALMEEDLKAMEQDPTVKCALCGFAPCSSMGVWSVSPEFGTKIGVPKGKERIFAYKLCRKCTRKYRGDTNKYGPMIESAILKHHGIEEPQ